MEKLLDRGYSVSVFDICQNFELPGVAFHQGDLCDKQVRVVPEGLASALRLVDHMQLCQAKITADVFLFVHVYV